jgi:hypothetical protein
MLASFLGAATIASPLVCAHFDGKALGESGLYLLDAPASGCVDVVRTCLLKEKRVCSAGANNDRRSA